MQPNYPMNKAQISEIQAAFGRLSNSLTGQLPELGTTCDDLLVGYWDSPAHIV